MENSLNYHLTRVAILLLLAGDLLVFDPISCAPAFCQFFPAFLFFQRSLVQYEQTIQFQKITASSKFNDFKKCCDKNVTKSVGMNLQI